MVVLHIVSVNGQQVLVGFRQRTILKNGLLLTIMVGKKSILSRQTLDFGKRVYTVTDEPRRLQLKEG